MTDEQLPGWAQAHRLIVEISNALADSETRLTRRLNDIGLNMARGDLTHTKIDSDRAEIANLQKEMVGLYRLLQHVEHHPLKGDPKPPEAA